LAAAAVVTLVVVPSATSTAPGTAPGTTLGGLAIGGLDSASLRSLISAAVQRLPTQWTIVMGTQRVSVPSSSAGLAVDVAATVDAALPSDRRFRRLPWERGGKVTPILTVDRPRLDQLVAKLHEQGSLASRDLRYARGTITVTTSEAGQTVQQLDIEQALFTAARRLSARHTPLVEVPVMPEETGSAPAEAAAARARALLAEPVTLQAGDASYELPASTLGPQLTIAAGSSALILRPSARDTVGGPAARALSRPVHMAELDAPPPVELLAEKGDARWSPIPARVSLISSGRTGQAVSPTAVIEAVSQLLTGADPPRHATVPVPTSQPMLSTGQAAPIDAVLGTFTTHFPCCPARVTNIKVIARRIDGTVVLPGGTFSVNGIVGRRTRAKGYVEAPFILDGALSTDIGGGVSQFATTAFNAAYFAGLRLDAHQAHSFYIDRYPPGREATVNYPTIDMAWTNDTSSALLVRTATTDTSVTVAIYGHDDGRIVTSASSDVEPRRDGGFRIANTRTVLIPAQPEQHQTFTTNYNHAPAH
jgi:hypothetical protein